MKITRLLMITAVSFAVVTGCKKHADEKDNDPTVGQDNATAELLSNDAVETADKAASGQKTFKTNGVQGLNCAKSVTIDTTLPATETITIDFGPANASPPNVCMDGRVRSGKIKVSVTGGRYFTPGASKTITFDKYFVNSHGIDGSRTITNTGPDSTGDLSWHITANLTITKSNGKVITWISDRTRTMIAGISTPYDMSDDKYSITGSANGIASNGSSYTVTIVKPIIKAISCAWIQQGSVDISVPPKAVRTVDYGNGNCDADATVTINGVAYPFTLN